MNNIRKLLWLGQITLLGALLICAILAPEVVILNEGISNFGKYKASLIPYVVGFCCYIVILLLTAHRIRRLLPQRPNFSRLLVVLAILEFLVLISTFPRYSSWVFADLHKDLGVVTFVYELAISIWLVVSSKRPLAVGLSLVEAVGCLIGLLSIQAVIHYLFLGQVVGTVGFGILLASVFADELEKAV